MLRGFTGYEYNGLPLFVRKEYEEAHRGMSECERLGELLDTVGSNIDDLLMMAEREDERLVYRRQSQFTDNSLERRYGEWVSTSYGYVHAVTGELRQDLCGSTESYPCWCVKKPQYVSQSAVSEHEGHAWGAAIGLGLLGLFALLIEKFEKGEGK